MTRIALVLAIAALLTGCDLSRYICKQTQSKDPSCDQYSPRSIPDGSRE